jgi:hypothetical protein
MPGTVELADGQLLLFRFPYDPQVNDALRDATDNRVHWDPKLHGFTLAVGGLRRNAAMVARLTRFISSGARALCLPHRRATGQHTDQHEQPPCGRAGGLRLLTN